MGQARASFSKCPSAFGITGLRPFHFFSECLLHFIMIILSSAQKQQRLCLQIELALPAVESDEQRMMLALTLIGIRTG